MMTRQTDAGLSGVLLVDKDPGFTSHDVVALCRCILGTRKAGHCGTLDPMATGLLLITVGKATRLQERLTSTDKVYTGTLRLGTETDSYDAEGTITAVRPTTGVDAEALRRAFAAFSGETEQMPPMYSAVKINGTPCYKLARLGETVERKARRVCVYDIELTRTDLEQAEADFTIRCSKGFYVRSFAHDVGRLLGCGAHLSALRRVRSGRFDVEQAVSVPALKAGGRAFAAARLIPPEEVSALLTSHEDTACPE